MRPISREAALAVLAALAARLALYGLSGSPLLVHLEYTQVADALIEGRGFVYEQYASPQLAWKEPLFIALLALVRAVAGMGDLPILVLQWGFGASLAAVATGLARELHGTREAALAAGLLTAVLPFALRYDTRFVHPLSLDLLLFALLCRGSIRICRSGSHRAAMELGALAGLVAWERTTLVVAWVGSLLVAGSQIEGPQRAPLARRATLALGLALALGLPWSARNAWVTGRFGPSTDTAHVLWLGNNPYTDGTYADELELDWLDRDPALSARIWGRPETEQYDAFTDEVKRFVRAQPDRAAALFGRKLVAFLSFPPTAGTRYEALASSAYRLWFLVFAATGAAGAVLRWRRRPDSRLPLAVLAGGCAALALVHAATAVDLKHRAPLDLALVVCAAGLWPRVPRRPARFGDGSGRDPEARQQPGLEQEPGSQEQQEHESVAHEPSFEAGTQGVSPIHLKIAMAGQVLVNADCNRLAPTNAVNQ